MVNLNFFGLIKFGSEMKEWFLFTCIASYSKTYHSFEPGVALFPNWSNLSDLDSQLHWFPSNMCSPATITRKTSSIFHYFMNIFEHEMKSYLKRFNENSPKNTYLRYSSRWPIGLVASSGWWMYSSRYDWASWTSVSSWWSTDTVIQNKVLLRLWNSIFCYKFLKYYW